MATPGPQGLQHHIFLFLLFDDVILFSSEIDLSLMALFTQLPSSTVLYSLLCRGLGGARMKDFGQQRLESPELHSCLRRSMNENNMLSGCQMR